MASIVITLNRSPLSRRRSPLLATTAAALVATGTMLGVATPGVAQATIAGQVGAVTCNRTPLPTIGQGASENGRDIQIFQERQGFTTAAAAPLDIPVPPSFPTTYNQPVQSTAILPAGTDLDSYFAFSDPPGRPARNVPYEATLSFSTPIIGVEVNESTLNATDSVLGAPGTVYMEQPLRGLELGPTADGVELVGPNTLSLHLMTSGDTDQVRILTQPSRASATTCPTPAPERYTEVASDGGIFNFNSTFYGSEGGVKLNQPMVEGAESPATTGYWTVAADGGVFAFGGAPFYGSTGSLRLVKPIVSMAPSETGLGYWLFASDGGVFSFGDAAFAGSEGAAKLAQPVVGGAADPHGPGYWLVAADGGIFSFGFASFFGSTGNLHLNKPIVAMAATPSGLGYWLVASDGGVFSFGDAAFYGSTGALHLNAPIVSMKATPTGDGYWLFAADGGVFSFGSAPFLGSTGAYRLNQPVVGGF